MASTGYVLDPRQKQLPGSGESIGCLSPCSKWNLTISR
jgi:hypothetical protein